MTQHTHPALRGLGSCLRAVGALWFFSGAVAHSTPAAEPARLMFDDFSYADAAALQAQGGWRMRSAAGHPGVPQARWAPEMVDVVADPQHGAQRWLRLRAQTDGTAAGTQQAQLCHARKYLEGTYAARIRFSDAPVSGADGDPVVQTFYAVAPLRHDFDPEFSELDWEYLPNGGWGSDKTRLYGISWQTVRLEPWAAYNQSHEEFGSHAGWRVLVMQVAQGRTRWYLDGRLLAEHGGRNYPVVPMSINFNLWFSPGGLLPASTQARAYEQLVDWVLHVPQQTLSTEAVLAQVQALRQQGVSQRDTVAPAQPPLPSSCDF
ncbi:glycoside hydrolase family 16 protein [Roseateles sp. BYS180W]|uniref:Glycoside hydrolase family 16 protein n=1 Tax=Roseateles rivi TaxID=3299028 RepID=A0ABW7FWB5_9BURK